MASLTGSFSNALKKATDPDGVHFLNEEFGDLRDAHADRLSRFDLYRSEADAARAGSTAAAIGGDVHDYGRKSRGFRELPKHHIILPLAKALAVKHSYRISGQLPDVVVDRRNDSPEERYRSDTMEKIVWAIIRESRGETQFSSGAWDGSEVGSTCFDIYFDIKRQMPIFRAVNPEGIIEVQGVDDPHDFQRVYHFWSVPLKSLHAQYREVLFRGKPVRVDDVSSDNNDGNLEMVTIVSMCDKERRIVFTADSEVGLYEYQHNYGFVPYVVIPNIGPERDVWGWADYEFVRPLAHYIQALFSREADIIRAVANGSYIERGTGQTPQSVKDTLLRGGVIPSRRDGSVEPIDPPDVPGFEEAHAQRAMEMFKMLGFAPDASWGSGISGSATDRGLMLQPLVEYTAMKQKNWEAGLGRLFSFAYRMMEGKMAGKGATYAGSVPGKYSGQTRFSLQIGPGVDPIKQQRNGAFDALEPDPGELEQDPLISYPRSPKELFAGDYSVRFTWNNRLDPDDPAYVLSEVNKFTAGAQSLRRTLERLGVEAPEDEMKAMEDESERFPWINQGLIQLIRAQISAGAQGDGGGGNQDPAGAQASAAGMAAGPQGGALGADAGAAALGSPGPLYGGA